MLQLFYGRDSLRMDEYYLEFRKNYSEIVPIENLFPQTVEEKLGTTGLFSEKKLFVFKNIFAKQIRLGKVSQNLDQLLKVLARFSDRAILFIEEDEKKLKYYKQYFPNILTKEFKVSQVLFTFLDSFKPGNFADCFRYWQKAQLTDAPELIFFLLKRRLRELLAVRQNELRGNYQPWYLAKLKSQSQAFETAKLLKIYHSLFNFEVGQKQGIQPLKVSQALETIIALNL